LKLENLKHKTWQWQRSYTQTNALRSDDRIALFGVVMVYSASAMLAQSEHHGHFYYVIKQAIWTAIGLVAMLAAMQFDYNRLRDRRIVYGLLLLTVFMLLAVFAFFAYQRCAALDQV